MINHNTTYLEADAIMRKIGVYILPRGPGGEYKALGYHTDDIHARRDTVMLTSTNLVDICAAAQKLWG